MRLHIGERERKGIVILDLKGPLTLGQGCLGLRDKLAALSASGKVNIILNFQAVAETDSMGLGALAFGHAALHQAGGRLVLVNVNDTHLKLFLLTRRAAFEFSEDELDAVDSFFPDRTLKHFDVLEFVGHKNQRGSNLEISGPSYLLR